MYESGDQGGVGQDRDELGRGCGCGSELVESRGRLRASWHYFELTTRSFADGCEGDDGPVGGGGRECERRRGGWGRGNGCGCRRRTFFARVKKICIFYFVLF